MAFDGDPYRTLGLSRGASLDEVKRAYRRLAKANHPDAAGSAALARFLAIQAAYEQLVEGRPRPGAKPRGPVGGDGGGGRGAGAARRSSEADPDRADATRRAYGSRARGQRPAEGPTGRTRPAGGPSARERATSAGDTGRFDPDGDTGRSDPDGDTGRSDPDGGRRHGKATLGSTSYDEAATGPIEPDWSGASWYGTTSGTYWTINPKEYADPRKHGPEYQARARRATGRRPGSTMDEGPAGPAAPPSQDAAPRSQDAAPGADDERTDTIHASPSWWSTSGEPAAESTAGPAPSEQNARRRVDEPSSVDDDPVPDPARALASLARALTDPRTGGLRGRAIRAFVGWVPIALGIGWILGETTGCSRFAATCDPAVDPLTVLAQGAALLVLLLAPMLASLAAGAALGLLVAAVVATLVLSAGTAADEASRRTTLGLLLVLGWLAGLAIVIAHRVRNASSRVGPVS